jgi:hypothetical protein
LTRKEEKKEKKYLMKNCKIQNCRKPASWGYTYGKALRCKKHHSRDMFPQYMRCICGKKEPYFGHPEDNRPSCCHDCKEIGMIDIKNIRCICGKRTSFGYPNDKRAYYCVKCKSPDMVDIKNRKCACGKQVAYGYPGRGRVCCVKCKKNGMIYLTKYYSGNSIRKKRKKTITTENFIDETEKTAKKLGMLSPETKDYINTWLVIDEFFY